MEVMYPKICWFCNGKTQVGLRAPAKYEVDCFDCGLDYIIGKEIFYEGEEYEKHKSFLADVVRRSREELNRPFELTHSTIRPLLGLPPLAKTVAS